MNRRTFIRTTAAATTLALGQTATVRALEADNRYRRNIGIQLYTLRNALANDTSGTLKQVADAGYQQVEPFGFPNAVEMIKVAKDLGMQVNSSHFEWDSVIQPKDAEFSDFAKILESALKSGLSHLVIPYLRDEQRGGLDVYKKIAENANKAAALAKKAGIQLSYHNHNFEFEPKEDGVSGYDILIKEFSEEMMFEIDVFWVKAAGLDPVELIRKLKGRVAQLHLKDLKQGFSMPSYSTAVPEDAFQELGNGIIPMEPIIAAAGEAGVKHCHVEQDQSPDPLASIRQSMGYLQKL